MLPAGIVENRDMITGPETEDPPQMTEFFTEHRGLIVADVLFRNKEPCHAVLISPQQERCPLFFLLASDNSKAIRGKTINDVFRLMIQNPRKNEKALGSHSRFERA